VKISTSMKTGALALLGGALLGLTAPAAKAQQPGGIYQPGSFESVDVVGNGFDYGTGNGEPTILTNPGDRAPHFGTPSASQVSASAEFERWSTDAKRYGGNRSTYLLTYDRDIKPGLEGQVILPYQRLHINPGFDHPAADGFADTEVDIRKYIVNAKDPNAVSFVASLRGFLPTGNWERGIGLHQWGVGPSVIASKPFNNTLAYTGLGYTYSRRYNPHVAIGFRPDNFCPWYYWAGASTQYNQKWGSQAELLGFVSNNGEQYLRGLVGLRYAITPSMGFQVNYKHEFRAAGKAETLSIGWSDLF